LKAPIRTQSADGVFHEFPSGTSVDTIDSMMKLYADAMKTAYPQWPRLPVGPEQAREQISITDEDVANWPRRWQAVATILAPPFGVLIIGIGLFWAAVGFKRGQV
jgi:hypothetical protein